MSRAVSTDNFRQILGVRFYIGTASEAVDAMERHGGLLAVPAAPALKELPHDRSYRDALLGADLVITDSSLMVLAWWLFEGDKLTRLSGLRYMEELLRRPSVRRAGNTFWVMASKESAERNLSFLRANGCEVDDADVYIAPKYGREVEDAVLLEKVNTRQPQHIVVTIGGGTQEQLGLYLKRGLNYRPAIHCLGAAIAFLSGDQVRIPMWADRHHIGWLFRCFSNPKRYAKRYWEARHLVSLMFQYRERLPELRKPQAA